MLVFFKKKICCQVKSFVMEKTRASFQPVLTGNSGAWIENLVHKALPWNGESASEQCSIADGQGRVGLNALTLRTYWHSQ